MSGAICAECGWDTSLPIIDPDCETCYKRHRRMYRRGQVSDYPATTAYRDALGSNCPCGTAIWIVNMGCKRASIGITGGTCRGMIFHCGSPTGNNEQNTYVWNAPP